MSSTLRVSNRLRSKNSDLLSNSSPTKVSHNIPESSFTSPVLKGKDAESILTHQRNIKSGERDTSNIGQRILVEDYKDGGTPITINSHTKKRLSFHEPMNDDDDICFDSTKKYKRLKVNKRIPIDEDEAGEDDSINDVDRHKLQYEKELSSSLLNPSLSEEEKVQISRQLAESWTNASKSLHSHSLEFVYFKSLGLKIN